MDTQKAVKNIAEISPDAAGLLAQFMEQNANDLEKINEMVMLSYEESVNYWRERALFAEGVLTKQRAMVDRIFPPEYN